MEFVVLLRGINVGGIRIQMADLRTALGGAGYTDVRTVLASGNVRLTATTTDPAVVRADVEGVLRSSFGYNAWVVVVTVDQHGNTSAASIPLALDAAVRDGRIKKGQNIMMEGVGGGFTWGAVLARITDDLGAR